MLVVILSSRALGISGVQPMDSFWEYRNLRRTVTPPKSTWVDRAFQSRRPDAPKNSTSQGKAIVAEKMETTRKSTSTCLWSRVGSNSTLQNQRKDRRSLQAAGWLHLLLLGRAVRPVPRLVEGSEQYRHFKSVLHVSEVQLGT